VAEPRVAFQGGRTRFFDAAERPWTVYDCRRVDGHIRRVAPAAQIATWRVFVGADGKRHAYRFQRDDSRELDPELLTRQLSSARWAETFRPNRRSRR